MNERIPTLIVALDALDVQQAALRELVNSLKSLSGRPTASAPASEKARAAVLRMNLSDIEQVLGPPGHVQQALMELSEFHEIFIAA
jgi:hypothetical protein